MLGGAGLAARLRPVLLVLGVVGSVVLAQAAGAALPRAVAPWRPLLGAVLFVVLSVPILLLGPPVMPRPVSAILTQCVLAGAFFGACTFALGVTVSGIGVATFAAPALSEEFVFRVALPRALARALRGRWTRIAACLIAQATFAACHALPWTEASMAHPIRELGRIFVAGLWYWFLVSAGGLWVAAGVHGALNADLARSVYVFHARVRGPEIVLLGVLGLLVVFRSCQPSRAQRPITKGRER